MKRTLITLLIPVFLLFVSCISCTSDKDDSYEEIIAENVAQYIEGEELLAGNLGVNSTSSNAFGSQIDGLSLPQSGKFSTGDSLFNQNWVSSPASTTARDGLGPTFNAKACSTCHFRDGRGKPLVNGETSTGFLMRISLDGYDENGGAIAVPNYGTQIQDRSNNGIAHEAQVNVVYEYITGEYPDGEAYELQRPIYSVLDEQFGAMGNVNMSPRIGQQTIGLGLIGALPDSEIIKFEDVEDTNGDGISGKANYVYNPKLGETDLGKYGWKANTPTLELQVAGAFHGDMGLTTSIFNEENCPSPQQDCIDAENGGTPEVTDDQLERVVFYQSHLAVPNRRDYKEQNVLEGKVLFNSLNCIGCHAINQVTGNNGITDLLNGITIKPYSDFLLHDMGAELADNRTDFLATGNEWRTQPLWGIGLISGINGHTFFMHDGRARNIEEAILWHGGEAEKSKEDFKQLTKEQRDQVISFINSL